MTTDTNTAPPQGRKLGKGAIIAIASGAAIITLVGTVFAVNNSVTNTGNKKEAGLNAQYLDNQNNLSDCITQIREVSGVAKAENASFTQAMNDAVKGRYDGRSAEPGQMFSAIVENYPDLSGINKAFNKAYVTITGCRSDYRKIQSKLLDRLRDYDSWRTGSLVVRTFGGDRPSNNLVAQIGTDRSRKGQAALDQMYTIVLVKDAKKAYEDGELTPEDPFASTAPSASSTR